jgi:hypothetical protein
VYESKHQAPLDSSRFARRMALHFAAALGLLAASLAIGVLGYRFLEDLPWIDAFLNAAMLLGGMGPVNAPQTAAGKLFAGLYALYAGLVFLMAAAVLFSPIVHRLAHRFHWDQSS